jgi:hypothetical protein
MPPFRLAPRVHVCASEDGAVLLDLTRDAYVGFSAEQSSALSSFVADWPKPDVPMPVSTAEAEAFVAKMIGRGLLVKNEGVEVDCAHAVLPQPTHELMPLGEMRWSDVHLTHLLRFLRALTVAWAILRFAGLPAAVQRVSHVRPEVTGIELRSLRQLLSSYCHLRLFFFRQRGRCLLDTVVLLEFLQQFRVYPPWVIGAQIRPFAAHSWLQIDSAVLNGTAEYVSQYRRLLAI